MSDLIEACLIGDLEKVKVLIENNPDIEKRDEAGETAFTTACLNENNDNNSVEIVKLFLKKNVNLESKNLDGETGFHSACVAGAIRIVEVLLEYGINFEAINLYNKTGYDIAYDEIDSMLTQDGMSIYEIMDQYSRLDEIMLAIDTHVRNLYMSQQLYLSNYLYKDLIKVIFGYIKYDYKS